MKPTYCSGGTIITGRLPDFKNISRKSVKNDSQNKTLIAQCRNATRRQHLKEEQRRSISQDSICHEESTETMPARPSSPFIVYRSAKYVSPHVRFLKTARGYAKYYIVAPVALFANRCRYVFYQLCGFLLLLLASPLWILLFLSLFVFRRLRMFLIQRLYPGLQPVNDNHYSYKFCETNQFLVNSLVWTKGKLDVDTIKNRFKLLFTEDHHLHHLLRLKLTSKFGVALWETSKHFDLDNHIVEAPKRFRGFPIVDEPLKELHRMGSKKSTLKTYISYCVSLPMEGTVPPWKIHVISYNSREDADSIREKTCLVIRMHVALINNSNVRDALRELFVSPEVERKNMILAKVDDTDILSTGGQRNLEVNCYNEKISRESAKVLEQKPLWELGNLRQVCIGEKLKEISIRHRKNFVVWVNLRLKQLEFHPKTFVMSIILIDIRDAIKRFAASVEVIVCELWINILRCVKYVLEILQALAAIPMIILASIMRRTKLEKLGIQRNANPSRRLISWSDLLHSDLIEEICKKTEITSSGNVIMMACSYAMRDYFQQNNIPDPGNLGFTVGNAMRFTSTMSLKAIRVPCKVSSLNLNTLQDLQNMEEFLEKYPSWKVLGLCYTMKYSNYFMPTCLAQKVQRRIVACYPFSFSHVSMNSVDSFLSCQEPIHQVYGEIVEEFSFWQMPPLSDFGVSITFVQYAGKTRLFVMSPFQAMDTVLTQRCNQYLIKIAEDVGVERSRIPYSRRSSPSSTSCSTPQNPPYIFNQSENCSFDFK